jgi:hypothetical protein
MKTFNLSPGPNDSALHPQSTVTRAQTNVKMKSTQQARMPAPLQQTERNANQGHTARPKLDLFFLRSKQMRKCSKKTRPAERSVDCGGKLLNPVN